MYSSDHSYCTTVEACTQGSAKDSARYADDSAIKVCTGHCTRSRICTVQGTVQENEYGGVSSFARGEILACTFPAQGWDALLGRRHCSTLWNTLDNSLLLGLAYQTMLLFRLACWISKVATSKLDSRLHRARGVRGPVGRAVFRVHSNPFQHFG